MRRRGLGRQRPSLIGTAARTAVVAGTATAVSGRVASGQVARAQEAAAQQQAAVDAAVTQRLAEQPLAAPPPPAPPGPPAAGGALTDDVVQQLRSLGELRDAGILTDKEFSAKKTQILGL